MPVTADGPPAAVPVAVSARPVAAVVWAGARGGWAGARDAARAARAARVAGTDATTRIGRALWTGGAAAVAATAAGWRAARGIDGAGQTWRQTWRQRVAAAWQQARAAAADVRAARRAQHGQTDGQSAEGAEGAVQAAVATETSSGVLQGAQTAPEQGAATDPTTDLATEPAPGPVAGEQGQQDAPAGPAGADSTTNCTTDSTTDTKETTMGALVMSGELETTEEMRAEVIAAQQLLDEAADAVAQLVAWAATLPDRMDAAPWETTAVLARVGEIAETLGTLQALDDAGESLTAMTPALDEADALGEHAAGIGAGGNVTAFAPA